MALFEDKIEQATDYLERLPPRDRMLLTVIVIGVSIFVGYIGYLVVGGRLYRAEGSNKQLTKNLKTILKLEGQFKSARRRVKALERQIKDNPVNLLDFLDKLGQKVQIKIDSMTSVPTLAGVNRKRSKIKEKSVRIEMRAVALGTLAKFLDRVENTGFKLVKVRGIRLKPNFSTPSKPDIITRISAYEIK